MWIGIYMFFQAILMLLYHNISPLPDPLRLALKTTTGGCNQASLYWSTALAYHSYKVLQAGQTWAHEAFYRKCLWVIFPLGFGLAFGFLAIDLHFGYQSIITKISSWVMILFIFLLAISASIYFYYKQR